MDAWALLELIKTYNDTEQLANEASVQETRRGIVEVLQAEDPALLRVYERLRQAGHVPVQYVASEYCPKDHQALPLATLQHLRLVDEVVCCEHCGSILAPNFSSDIVCRITPTDWRESRLKIPALAARLGGKADRVEVIDVWGHSHYVNYDYATGSLCGVAGLYRAYMVRPGDTIRVREVNVSAAKFRAEVDLVAAQDVQAALSFLLTRVEASIATLVQAIARDRAKVFSAYQVQLALDRALSKDPRFARSGGGWQLSRLVPGLTPSTEDLDFLLARLEERAEAVPLDELTDLLLRLLVESHYELSRPIGRAHRDDAVFLGTAESLRLGKVLAVSAHDGMVTLELRGSNELVQVYPAQPGTEDPDVGFRELLARSIQRRVSASPYFTYFGGYVAAAKVVPALDPGVLWQAKELILRAKEPMTTLQLAALDPVGHTAGGRLWELALNAHLTSDNRIVNVGDETSPLWTGRWTSPPRDARYTLTEDSCALGYIKLTPGMREIVANLGLSDSVSFVVYGDYEVTASLDMATQRVYGPELLREFKENNLHPGDVVRIQAPVPPATRPRLYFVFTSRDSMLGPLRAKARTRRRLHLRERLVEVLRRSGAALHVQEIARRLSQEQGMSVEPGEVAAALSQSPHLFTQLPGKRGRLWGLAEWLSSGEQMNVDPTSLLLAIAEERLVVRCLEEAREPMASEAIVRWIADFFGISKKLVLATSFLDPTASDLTRLRDGRWALKQWIDEWRAEAAEAAMRLAGIEARRKSLEETQKQIAGRMAYQQQLATSISGLGHQVDAERKLLSKVTAMEVAAFEAAGRWRHLLIGLLLIGIPGSAVIAALGQPAAGGLVAICIVGALGLAFMGHRRAIAAALQRQSALLTKEEHIEALLRTIRRLEDELSATEDAMAEIDASLAPIRDSGEQASEEAEADRLQRYRRLLELVEDPASDRTAIAKEGLQ